MHILSFIKLTNERSNKALQIDWLTLFEQSVLNVDISDLLMIYGKKEYICICIFQIAMLEKHKSERIKIGLHFLRLKGLEKKVRCTLADRRIPWNQKSRSGGVLTGIGREEFHGESRALKTPVKAALRSLTALLLLPGTPQKRHRERVSHAWTLPAKKLCKKETE